MDAEIKLFNKHGQITIFIIFALIIIVIILIFFLLKKYPETEVMDDNNPQAYIESCLRESVDDALKALSPQGGDIEPKGSVLFFGIERTHLCYNNIFYEKCINQRPLLVEHIETEITNYITPLISKCFWNLESRLGRRYEIETGEMKITTRLHPKQVVVEIDKEFKMIRGTNIRYFNHFRMNMIYPIYDFAKIATEIANQEAQYCHFDELGYMILYPEYDISSTITGESNTIYTIRERATNKEFTFATKSCFLPAGF